MANTCVFVCAVSKSTENYVRILSNIKEIVKNDIASDSDNFAFDAEEIHIDFELANFNALRRVFPEQAVRFCFFHCLQSFYRRLSTTGFKKKLKPTPENAKFREFWDFISGIPSAPIHISEIRVEIIRLLHEFMQNVPNEMNFSERERLSFQNFENYLLRNYLGDNPTYPVASWCQFDTITQGPVNYSRTTNISEAVHSSLNDNFSRRVAFRTFLKTRKERSEKLLQQTRIVFFLFITLFHDGTHSNLKKKLLNFEPF